MNTKNLMLGLSGAVALSIVLTGCSKSGGSRSLPNDGQLHGVAAPARFAPWRPPGMVYVPQGTFHMGPSDEDVSYAFTARNKQISINGFWMDATEITNDEYRQFVYRVRDSIAATILGLKRKEKGSENLIDWKAASALKYDPKLLEKLTAMLVPTDNRIFGRMELDAQKLVYHSEVFDYKEAARRENANKPRSLFIIKKDIRIYPDTLVWVRDFTYSYNEPMSKRYFSHPAFGSYPVVGVNWKQANAFCEWRTQYMNAYMEQRKRQPESDFRLPTEAEWEYAARGGRSQAPYPWGGYYLRNKKGCLLANFKPGRGNYPEDGGFYTVRADAYWPNDFGLYNMAGNVSEWTSSLYHEGSYNFQHDMNPDIRLNAKDNAPSRMKRKVIRGGSWKDVGYFLQTSTRNYEFQDTTKSYIGFRCVIDLAPSQGKKKGF